MNSIECLLNLNGSSISLPANDAFSKSLYCIFNMILLVFVFPIGGCILSLV